ncbi:tetratricopeptide repeat protein [Nodularia chucula]|uniref:tetratricopeptide repeat protein n=1 Tax=Nodularia chucula TaxID=3093667 RepID=UPI0039C6887A
MKLNSQLKSALVASVTIIATITGSPLVLADSPNLNQPVNSTQVPQLAQFRGTPEEERSQLLQQARMLLSQGDFSGAEANLRDLTKKFPRYALAHFELGNLLFQQNQPEAAITAYQEAIRLNSNHALAHNGIGLVYASQNRWQEAITAYQKALNINPNYGDALANVAVAFLQNNQKNEGIASLEKALEIFKSQSRNERVLHIEQVLQQLKNSDQPDIS